MKKIPKKLINKYKKMVEQIEDEYYDGINEVEEFMRDETGIEDLILFPCDGSIVGIGNESRTMKLIHF